MSDTAQQKETLGFQAEVNQLLHLMINALYSNKEIFLRELISNASDACDRLRYEALSDEALLEDNPDIKIHISFDEKEKTITIEDNGIGMSRDEIVAHLGTIAKSGTREFLSSLTGDQAKDSQLIGQFGVGFYSAFIVADKVTVISRRAGMTEEHGVRWESDGKGEYTIENINHPLRGTQIILHLKDDETEFLDEWKLKQIITKYSDHIAIPILMQVTKEPDDKSDEKTEKKKEWEQINRATALWTLPRNQIKPEDYKTLYKHIAHDFEDPLLWAHNKVEGKLEYINLLYIPTHAPFDLWNPQFQRGLKLYVKRVFIMDNAEQFLPRYLRFVKGIIDSNDLPLNISREILQNNKTVKQIRSAVTKRVLNVLEKFAQEHSDEYAKFWETFGKVLKEGPAEDYENRENIAKLLRFSTTFEEDSKQNVTLSDYVKRMPEAQKNIYYVTAENFLAAKNSPHLEIFKKKGIEVLLLSDRIDEWLVSHLNEFEGKPLQSVAKGSLDLGELEDKQEIEDAKKAESEFTGLLEHVKQTLGERIKEARFTHRLTTSPACIVADENELNINMQRILKSVGQEVPTAKPIFEINPEHAIIKKLQEEEKDEKRFSEWTRLLFDQAVLAEGGQLEDPATFVARLNQFLLEMIQ
ncbi:MAG: molecular chaperone HtpG [Pseudomonadota bacterium]|nr:molecular chaperone HtpG [Gammaproteobacteria bacterium]MBU1629368.1 molecular chaperone HtpG [Gammaproteobacteria bacterium]MBU1926151.1 molecular chaperone HtpG [Gammaproteobacteria bacterium]MBU2546096.1 molecular chaperone HtpG [Gammaproteobacteria bacterium]